MEKNSYKLLQWEQRSFTDSSVDICSFRNQRSGKTHSADIQRNSGLALSLSLFPPTVPICWLIGIVIKPIIAKDPWTGYVAYLKMLHFVRWSRVKLSSTRQKIFVRLRTSFALKSPRCFKNQVWSLVNLVISKKCLSYQEHLRFTSTRNILPQQLEKPKSIFLSCRIARNLVLPKNTPPKKDADTQTMISILSRNLEAHALTAWKNTLMLVKPKTGWGVRWTD